jgi:hypothetical protein
MSVYRLDPINPTDPDWRELSTHVETLWVAAPNDGRARDIAANKTLVLVARTPLRTKRFSPWLEAKMAHCSLDSSRPEMKDGEVATSSGKRI